MRKNATFEIWNVYQKKLSESINYQNYYFIIFLKPYLTDDVSKNPLLLELEVHEKCEV